MIDRGPGVAGIGQEIGVALASRPGRVFLGDELAHHRLAHDPAQHLQAGDHGVAIGARREIAWLDCRRVARVI
jgi:hypothetical protein